MKMLCLLLWQVNLHSFYVWHSLKQNLSFEGATQANDLPPIRDIDPPAVVAAKRRIQEIITEWLDEAAL